MKQSTLACLIGMSLLGLTGCPNLNSTGGDPVNGTLHTGVITASETWTKAQSPHIIRGDVMVEGTQTAAKITIEPGAVVQFENDAELEFGKTSGTTGILEAKGTATESITFTGATQSKGSWYSITLGNGANLSTLQYCQIQYGGKGEQGALSILGDSNNPTVKNCTFDQNFSYAVMAYQNAAFTAFENNTITNSGSNPLFLSADAVGTLGEGNTFTNNGQNAIYVQGCTLTKDARWRKLAVPYRILDSELSVNTAGVDLTLDPGCRLEFGAGNEFNVGAQNGSTLFAKGTATESITLTAIENATWAGLTFNDHATDGTENPAGGCYLDYVVIDHAGGGSADGALINIYDSKPILKNLTLTNSTGFAIRAYGSANNTIPSLDYLNAAIATASGIVSTPNVSYPDPT